MGISHMKVERIWARHGLKPRRLKRYKASDDPDFEQKAADIIGLYLNPPAHAAVFCVDEKTTIQALDRLDPVLPLSPGRIEQHGFEYYRHGTLSLLRRIQYENGEGSGQDRSAPYERGVRGLPWRHRCSSTPPPGDPHHLRQPLGPQKPRAWRDIPTCICITPRPIPPGSIK